MDVNEILSSLTDDDIEKLKSAANSLLGTDVAPTNEAKPVLGAEMLSTIQRLSSRLNGDDERTQLIKAIKPMLSEPRREKADEVIKILRLLSLLPLLRESGLLKDLL